MTVGTGQAWDHTSGPSSVSGLSSTAELTDDNITQVAALLRLKAAMRAYGMNRTASINKPPTRLERAQAWRKIHLSSLLESAQTCADYEQFDMALAGLLEREAARD